MTICTVMRFSRFWCVGVWGGGTGGMGGLHFYAEEVLGLLLSREFVAHHQQVPSAPEADDSPEVPALELPQPVARLSVLFFLDQLRDRVAEENPGGPVRRFLDEIILGLIALNRTPDFVRVANLNSTPYNEKLRCWQALSVLSWAVHEGNVAAISEATWETVMVLAAPAHRHYLELFAARLCQRFPEVTLPPLLTHLHNINMTPQVITSFMSILGYTCLAADSPPLPPRLAPEVVRSLMPWLGATHSHARVLAQAILVEYLPKVLGEGPQPGTLDSAYLATTLAFLRNHREIVKLMERQRGIHLGVEVRELASFEGLLASPFTDYMDLQPTYFLDRLKQAMKEQVRGMTSDRAGPALEAFTSQAICHSKGVSMESLA
jgi:hypothetical protein